MVVAVAWSSLQCWWGWNNSCQLFHTHGLAHRYQWAWGIQKDLLEEVGEKMAAPRQEKGWTMNKV